MPISINYGIYNRIQASDSILRFLALLTTPIAVTVSGASSTADPLAAIASSSIPAIALGATFASSNISATPAVTSEAGIFRTKSLIATTISNLLLTATPASSFVNEIALLCVQ
ncbi:hypothetical protein K469DRAFT_688394 [Zopfia rhizophila CBS 207.26]|uniref:Uncharacterized protein n=1 Tax=Zopfia rhizophila CBS 207.26 TaxID=1314779 RepID=A0A6A6DYM7_9PEZI|nr:hypothetical protein K469DRAFT_688394 [Zopfia rhizophila CBS 207.26]